MVIGHELRLSRLISLDSRRSSTLPTAWTISPTEAIGTGVVGSTMSSEGLDVEVVDLFEPVRVSRRLQSTFPEPSST